MTRTSTTHETKRPSRSERPAIFGLRYLEEEAAEIHDVVGCLMNNGLYTGTGCDDHDIVNPLV